MNKFFNFVISALLLSLFFSVTVSAEASIPDELYNAVPDGILDESEISPEDLTAEFIFVRLRDELSRSLSPALSSASTVIGILILSSASGLYFRDAAGGKLKDSASVISTLTLACILLSSSAVTAERFSAYISSVTAFVTSLTPIMTGTLVSSANTVGAAVTSSGFLLFSAAAEVLSSTVFLPFYRVLSAFAVTSSVTPTVSAHRPLTAFLRRTFITLFSFSAVIYVTVLSYQSHLAAAADSLAMRSAKFAVSSSIPVVGGAISDAVRTAAASLSVIKNGTGAVGIAVLILITAPVIAELFISSAVLGFSAFAAGILGCEREGALISEMKGVNDLAIAVVSLVTTVFIIALSVFIKTIPAIGA